ncbi:MAG: adenylate/guanylate cyclase domain-containing protein [Xanthobacteraceae bacterium]|jgi:class 3 adenylate cyclase
MIRLSIRRKIIGIALILIVLMTIAALLSMALIAQVAGRLDDLTQSYVPAYAALARANIHSLERAVALRRMVIEKLQSSPDEAQFAAAQKSFEASGQTVDRETKTARALIDALIAKGSTFGDASALVRIDTRLADLTDATRRDLNEEIARVLPLLDGGDRKAIAAGLDRIDELRDQLDQQLDAVRNDMIGLLQADSAATVRKQQTVLVIAIILTVLAAALGLVFSLIVSGGLTRPVRRLLDGARAVQAGRLDETLAVTSQDEIGHLTVAFNSMVEQLRAKERMRETFGRYVDPRIVERLISGAALATEGQRRVMTVLFCDVKGFVGVSEEMTPQGLVKVMNRYFSTMSAPIHAHGGIIDKYIGDAIMAYWGPPFTADGDQAKFASLAAVDMLDRVEPFRAELPDLLGLKNVPISFDIRIGIATGEALVGSVGSEVMMSYTVMGETVNLASRLEGANKLYGTRILALEPTVAAAGAAIETREIDRVALAGQSRSQPIYEIMSHSGGLTREQAKLRARYAQGLAAYRSRRWEEARKAFAAALEADPPDGPSLTMLKRIDLFVAAPPAADWDGAWHLEQK